MSDLLNIKSLIKDNMNPQVKLMQETRGLQAKWERSGLLEGLKGIEKASTSILLENQAKQLLDESSTTGTAPNSEQWMGVALPLVRRVFAEIAAKEFVSVQPMNLPSGLIFYLDFKYGSDDHLGHKKGESVFGGTQKKLGSTDAPVNGFYGAGRFAYTLRRVTSSVLTGATVEQATWDDLKYNDAYSASVDATGSVADVYKVTIDINANTEATAVAANGFIYNIDLLAVKSFELWEDGTASVMLPEYAFARNTGSLETPYYQAVFFVSASAQPTPADLKLYYTIQPTEDLRGDFEAGKTPGEGSGNSAFTVEQDINADIRIPEVNLELKSEPIVAKTRKLKAVWTPELAQDLNAYHSIDAEVELTALLSEQVSMEIDLEILGMLIEAAPAITTEAWSAQIGVEYSKRIDANGEAHWTRIENASPNRTAYVKSTWFQTLGNKIQKVSNMIHRLTLRGGANFMVCSPDVATILESIPGYVVNTDGDQAKFAMGVSRVGSFASRFQVYKNPYMTENCILIGFRGNNFLETGAVYAPYIPLIQTPLVYDPDNFTPRRGVLTRYSKKLIRPEFYGKVYVTDLDMV